MNLTEATAIARKALAGEASPEEKILLKQYIIDHEALHGVAPDLLPLQELLEIHDAGLPTGMEDRILQSIIGTAYPGTHKKPVIRRLLRIAVAAALLGFMALAFYSTRTSYHSTPEFAVITSASGVVKVVILPDGTHVQLNGGTTLRYNNSPGQQREVWLNGEAFFEVSKDVAHPFIIHAPSFTTKVLGTSFNIKVINGQLLAEVAVATGKVQVSLEGHAVRNTGVVLTAGEKTVYREGDTAGLVSGKADVATIGAWMERRFYYDQAPLSVILNDIERAYGLRFHAKDPAVLACTYSTTFKTMPAQEILHALSLMSQVQFQQKNGLIEVTGKPCH